MTPPELPPPTSLPGRYFDDLYAQSPQGDPWEFRTSAYEATKYAATLARLPRPRYRRALEVGCSIGVFTRLLADRTDHLLAIDIAPLALDAARAACRDSPQVRFEPLDLLKATPLGPFDLIVVAEVAYYWTPPDAQVALDCLARQLDVGGHLILVHWRAAVPDYPQTGDAVHELAALWARQAGMIHLDGWVNSRNRADLYERSPVASG